MKDHPSFEYHTFTRLSPESPADRALVEEYWLSLCEGQKVEGLTVQDTTLFK